MIKTALVAMTIVGCDCDAKLCEYIGESPAQWATVADCEAAMKSQMLHQRNFDYPLVSGICRTAQADPTQVAAARPPEDATPSTKPAVPQAAISGGGWTINRPAASVGSHPAAMQIADDSPVYESMLSGGRAVLYRTENGYMLVKAGIDRAASARSRWRNGRPAGSRRGCRLICNEGRERIRFHWSSAGARFTRIGRSGI